MTDYLQPDERWRIFNYPTRETYIEKLVVKGLFNKLVPDEISESYLLAEYMMAHAYYHYPLYDEALSKLLRILEMAVKIRCKQLGVSHTYLQKGKKKNKQFHQLINDIDQAEQGKNLKPQLNMFRDLRNVFMHPSRHSFSGGIHHRAIRAGIVLINNLFLPECLLSFFQSCLSQLREQLAVYSQTPSIMARGGRVFLIEHIEFQEAVCIEGQWWYAIAVYYITRQIKQQLEDHSYHLPLTLTVTSLEIFNTSFFVLDDTDKPISFSLEVHEDDVAFYQKYIREKKQVSQTDAWMYDGFIEGETEIAAIKFLYTHLYKTESISAKQEALKCYNL